MEKVEKVSGMIEVKKITHLVNRARQTGLGQIFGANMANQVIAFASNYIVIRILSKSEFGVFSYAFNIYSFFALAAGFGMESAGLQLCSEHRLQPEKANAYVRYSFIAGSCFNVLLGILIILYALSFHLPLKGANQVLLLFAAMPFLTTIFNCQQMYFRYNLMNVFYSRFSVINTLLLLIGSILGSLFLKAPGMVIFRNLGMVFSIVAGIWIFRFPVQEVFHAARLTIAEKKDMLQIALISMLNISTGQMLYLLDVFLIGLLITSETVVASYKTATIVPNALLFIPSALVVYIYPYFAQHKDDKRWVKQKFYTVLKYFAPVNALISMGLVVLAPLTIQILFGSQYLDAVPAFRLLSVSYFFSATFKKIIGNLLVTQRKLKVNFWVGILESLTNIVTNWILIHIFGAIGAAITTLFISVGSAIVVTIYFIFYLNKGIKEQAMTGV